MEETATCVGCCRPPLFVEEMGASVSDTVAVVVVVVVVEVMEAEMSGASSAAGGGEVSE